MATYTAPNYPEKLNVGDIINFPYLGNYYSYAIPTDSILALEVWGAEGGGSRLSGNTSSGLGGKGGYSKGEITVVKGQTLYAYVGGHGASSTSGLAAGGWNGGGSGYASSSGEPGNGGGGASDFRLDGTSLSNRIIIAGGGGGGGEDSGDSYGHGGGLTGVGYNTTYDASQTSAGSGGSLGQGGSTDKADGGGGGGGYYGGGTVSSSTVGSDSQGGGGGSGYIGGVSNGTTIAGNASMPSPTSSSNQTGHQGNGYARITVIEITKPVEYEEGDVITYSFTGASRTFIPSKETTIRIEVWGAEGGNRSTSAYGGKGGYAKGEITLKKEEPITIYVGGKGDSTGKGWNGGGTGAYSNIYGGGATDVRKGGTALSNRIIVAGGGGSVGATNKPGGAGGGTSGESRTESYGTGGQGGTQTAGGEGSSSNTATKGTLGQGGNGIYYASGYGGAGGGGYYGGAGVYPDGSGDDDRGGGGGSGYVSAALTNTSLIAGNATMPSPTSSSTQTGQSGNGYCKITILSVKGAAVKIKVGSKWETSKAIKVRKDEQWIEAKAVKVFKDGVWKDAKS